jgi:N6-L-threonylcarbamoyladenine synthase
MATRILGIESSCDETAAAVVADGRDILSNVVASQVSIHRKYGGVVPELASREHLRSIVPIVREALEQARLQLNDVDAIAVTRGPGLVGSLLVGITYGKTLALSLGKPLVAVNHLEGHVHAVFLEAHRARRQPELPAACLIVSGGHTVVYEVQEARSRGHEVTRSGDADRGDVKAISKLLHYRRLGQTRDDAAGEAYDKVAKLLALGYPGGPVMDALAQHGRADSARFSAPVTKGNPLDFSFSGIKTAVLRHVRAHPEMESEIAERQKALARGERKAEQLLPLCSRATLDLVASFQHAVVSDLIARTGAAAELCDARTILVSGGVAANSALRREFEEAARHEGFEVFFPSRVLSTDNAAMIAAAAYPRFLCGELAAADLNAQAVLPLA